MVARRWQHLAQVHSITGLVPLLLFVIVHVAETSAAASGRSAFRSSVLGGAGGWLALTLETALIVLPLCVHAALGITLAMRDRTGEAGVYRSRALRTMQRVSGVAVLIFVLFHLGHTWVGKFVGGDAGLAYDVMRTELGTPMYLGLYLMGMSALCLHVAQGLAAFARRQGIVTTARAIRASRVAGWALGVALWVVMLNSVSHFAVGRGIVWAGSLIEDAHVEESP